MNSTIGSRNFGRNSSRRQSTFHTEAFRQDSCIHIPDGGLSGPRDRPELAPFAAHFAGPSPLPWRFRLHY